MTLDKVASPKHDAQETMESSEHCEMIADGESKENQPSLQLDKNGLALVPQPTSHPNDPLTWSSSLKLLVALQVSWIAFLGPMSAATANPAFGLLSEHFGISVVEASYEFTVYIVCAGVGPLAVVPFANIYGRRPIYLLGILIPAVTNIAAAYCNTWATMIITRVFNGLAAGSAMAIGAATICDLYFQHQRGLYLGIYTFFLTNGPHVAPLIGGFVSQHLGWENCFRIPGYMQLGTLLVAIFCLPETLFPRTHALDAPPLQVYSYVDLLLFKGSTRPHAPLRLCDFTRPLQMIKYVPVIVCSLYYMTAFTYGMVMFAVTGAKLFKEFYGFNTAQTGLFLSIPLLIGGVIGELNAGWVTDWMANRYARQYNGERKPEARLDAIWGAFLMPIGVIVEGVCLSHSKTVGWIGAAFGMGIAGLGLQIATTVVYAYTTHVGEPRSRIIVKQSLG